MDQEVTGLITDKGLRVEPETEALSDNVVKELIDLVRKAERQGAARSQSGPAHWSYQVPFAGVRYYSHD
jgi:hypothetical protein